MLIISDSKSVLGVYVGECGPVTHGDLFSSSWVGYSGVMTQNKVQKLDGCGTIFFKT